MLQLVLGKVKKQCCISGSAKEQFLSKFSKKHRTLFVLIQD